MKEKALLRSKSEVGGTLLRLSSPFFHAKPMLETRAPMPQEAWIAILVRSLFQSPHVYDMIFLFFFPMLWDYLRLLHFTRINFGRVVDCSGAKNRSASSDWRKLCSPRNQNSQRCHVRWRSYPSPLHFSAERSERNLFFFFVQLAICLHHHISFHSFSFSVLHHNNNNPNKPLHRRHQDRRRTRT